MTTERRLDEIVGAHFPHFAPHIRVAIRAALREAHALGRDAERKRCAEVCRARAKDADAQIVDGTPGHKAVLLGVRYAEATACAKAIEEGER